MARLLCLLSLASGLALSGLTYAQDPDYTFRVSTVAGLSGGLATATVILDSLSGEIQGWSFGLDHDPAVVTSIDAVAASTTVGLDPDFEQYGFHAEGWTAGVVISFVPAPGLPPGLGYELHQAVYSTSLGPGETSSVCFADDVGNPPVDVVVLVGGVGIVPVAQCGELTVLDTPGSGISVVFNLESAQGAVDSGPVVGLALQSLGETVLSLASIGTLSGTVFRSVWVLCGTYPHNHVLTASEGEFLAQLVQDGVPVYLEGADIWGFDPVTPFSDYDGIYAPAVGDGDDSFHGMVGFDHAGAWLAGMDATYTQDAALDDSTDRLHVTSGDLAGPDAGVVWRDDGSGGATNAYATGVFYDTAPGFGKVIVQSWEFGGYDGDTTTLMERYLAALGLGPVAVAPFQRGDSNGDGAVDIADPLFLEGELFSGGAPSLCRDASDANDDGSLDIADEIFLLSYLFIGGAVPPSPGPFRCGDDLTDDLFDCSSYDSCP